MPALIHVMYTCTCRGVLGPCELTSVGRLDKGRHVWGEKWRRVVGGPAKI